MVAAATGARRDKHPAGRANRSRLGTSTATIAFLAERSSASERAWRPPRRQRSRVPATSRTRERRSSARCALSVQAENGAAKR
jgi:hypothetical protein